MVKKFKTFGPQLVFAEQTAGSVVVTNEQKLSLYKKSQKSGISTDVLEEVYRRGYSIWNESFGQTAEQFAFDRVNSFIAGGFAADLDEDLMINEGKWPYSKDIKGSPTDDDHYLGTTDRKRAARKEIRKAIKAKAHKALMKGEKVEEEVKEPTGDLKKACWKGYTAVGMKMKNGRKVPNCVPVKEEVKLHKGKHFKTAETVEKQSHNPNDSDSRFDGTKSAKNVYQKSTPGQPVTEDVESSDSQATMSARAKTLNDLIATIQNKQLPIKDKTSVSEAPPRKETALNVPAKMTNALTTIKKVVKESNVCDNCDCGLQEEILNERGADSKGYFRSTESGAGLTAKGAKHFGVKTAVTEPNPGKKRAARRRSFCARMSGMKGPMKDEKGRPTRKAMSLRRWRCRS
jgi:hypothetical protein